MKLIVGLGNPGRIYANNRHNVGFKCLDSLAHRYGIRLSKRRAKAKIGSGEIGGLNVVLAKPQTFMNLSGEAVAQLVRRFAIPMSDLIVIYDDLDLPLGNIRIRGQGGPGGHKGMASIITLLGSQEFPRIRVGINPGQDTRGLKTPDYVLSDFSPEEKTIIKEVYVKVADAIHCLLTEGIEAAMNRFNR
jgi:PTH1 family peptidyl-tRNA hydrolase